jgi:peroxiredoxin
VRDEIRRYQEFEIQPLGVNPASTESHARYVAQLRLPFPLLSDPSLAISRAYGALKPDGKGISRSVYLIDRDGSILYSQAGAPGSEIILEPLRSG